MRRTTNSLINLDARVIQITAGSSNVYRWSNGFELDVKSNGSEISLYPIKQKIPIAYTKCSYGGTRPWMVCECGKRCSVLYLDKRFACRKCLNLAYDSQNRGSYWNMLTKADKIRTKLGLSAGVANPLGDKPKGMWNTTFWGLNIKYSNLIRGTSYQQPSRK